MHINVISRLFNEPSGFVRVSLSPHRVRSVFRCEVDVDAFVRVWLSKAENVAKVLALSSGGAWVQPDLPWSSCYIQRIRETSVELSSSGGADE